MERRISNPESETRSIHGTDMKRFKDIDDHNNEVEEMFKDLPPFTITITDGHDAAWLSSAMLAWVSGGDIAHGNNSLGLILKSAFLMGVKEGVTAFFDEGIKQGYKFPKCMKPLFIHMVGHALKKYQEGKDKE